MSQRILVMGDNHGDTTSLEQVVEDTAGETFDFIIHVGDLTNAWFDGISDGAVQLKEVESYMEDLAERGELVYIYGNRDGQGPMQHVTDQYSLSVGTRIPDSGVIKVDGQEFTQDPSAVNEDTILVTHDLNTVLLDHFTGRAYFSGHVHTGRYKGRCLNSAFLYRDGSHNAEPLIGGYFVVEVTGDDTFKDVDFRNLDRLKKIICPKHYERGILFSPDFHQCQFCYADSTAFEEEVVRSAFHGLTTENDVRSVSFNEIIEYAKTHLFETASESVLDGILEYLKEQDQDETNIRPGEPVVTEGRVKLPSET